MNWVGRHRPSPGTALGAAALMIALGGVAFAAIPDSNGTVHGCYQKSNGNLRVVESANQCRRSEQSISLASGASVGSGTSSNTLHLQKGEGGTVLRNPPFTIKGYCADVARVTITADVPFAVGQQDAAGVIVHAPAEEVTVAEETGSSGGHTLRAVTEDGAYVTGDYLIIRDRFGADCGISVNMLGP